MTMLKLGPKFYVNTDEVVLFQTYPSRPARRDKAAAVEAKIYKDATSCDTLRTLVHLRCGLVVGSAIGADALAKRPPIEAPVRHSTRGNALDGASVVTGADDNGAAAITQVEVPVKAPRGRSFPDGAANPNAKPAVAQEQESAEAKADDAKQRKSEADLSLFGRLLGRTDTSR